MHIQPVTDTELHQLRTEGYFTRENYFPPEAVDELERLSDRAMTWHEVRPGHLAYVTKPGRMTFVNELEDDSDVSQELRVVSLQPRIASLARDIVGPRARHYCYQIVYKHPKYQEPFCWHQDFVHTPADVGFFNMWLAMTDMTIENGCLRVLPKVGLDQILGYHETPYGHSCWPLDHPNQGIPIELKRGSILILTCRTLHMSGPNTTDKFRKAVLFAFMQERALAKGSPVPLRPYEGSLR